MPTQACVPDDPGIDIPDIFYGLAALPTSDIDWAASELDRAHSQLGLIGAVLPVGAFQTHEAAQRLAPIFDVAQKHASHLYIHTGPASAGIPGQRVLDAAPDDAPLVRNTLLTSETFALGAITLSQSGFLDPYPDVSVQIALLAGSASYLAAWLRLNPVRPGQPDPTALLRRLYYDTRVYGRAPHTVDFAAANIGADRILFGSDFPLAGTEKTIIPIKQSPLSRSDQQLIFSTNGRNLLESKGLKA